MTQPHRQTLLGFLVAIVLASAVAVQGQGAPDLAAYEWTRVYSGGGAGWAGRAGLQAVELHNRLFLMGGRTPAPTGFNPFNSLLWDDVWESRDVGRTWRRVAAGPTADPADPAHIWPARGYFQAVTSGGQMFVLGGQDFSLAPNPLFPANCPPSPGPGIPPPPCPPFVPASNFFNDVWRSSDGALWEQVTAHAPWQSRAGLSAIVFKGWIYVLGGSFGDDVAIGGTGRLLFNDVWRSRDGATWEAVTHAAPWAPRAGASVVEKNGYLYLLGGEDGFLCTFGPQGRVCPYYNDVWRSRDGAAWELVTPAAGWSPRPGHQCQVLYDTILCFGGFGFPTDPFVPAHPRDLWSSRDGASWTQVSDSPWNASGPEGVKYDFDSLVVRGGPGGLRPSILTFGGDREASFIAPDPLRVDDEVWRFSPQSRGNGR